MDAAATDQSPRVTVSVPVHNGAAYLTDCLESILGQSFEDLDIVISDGASDDGTEELCRTFAERDTRIRYVRSQRYLGITENYEVALRHAQGSLFCWIGSDDVLQPNYVRAIVEAFDEDPKLLHVCATARGIDAEWRREAPTPFLPGYRDDQLELNDPSPSARFENLIWHLRQCNCVMGLYRTEALRSLLPLEPAPGFDILLMAQLVLRGRSRQLTPELYLRRMHSTQFSRKRKPAAADNQFNRSLSTLAHLETVNLFAKQLDAIRSAPLAPSERSRCTWVLATRWFVARRRALAKDFLKVGRGAFSSAD